jgi:uncharacterized RDD family membrane protein YckC
MSQRRLDNRKEIELAEGISVHLHPAGLVPRLVARLLDITFQSIASIVLLVPMSLLAPALGSEASMGVNLLIYFFLYWFYDPMFELMKTPATPGKRIMKLRVVQVSGAPTNFSSSFLRALLWPIDLFPFGIAGISAVLATRHSQRLGDLAGGTVVVHAMEESLGSFPEITAPPIRPNILLQREEQVAFVEFGRRHNRLSEERQNEIVSCFEPHKGHAPDAISYALGVSNHLSQNEG